MRALPCATCGQNVPSPAIKYHTPDKKNIFCDAQCSLKWFQENKHEQE